MERAILEALPPAALCGPPGGAVRLMVTREGALLDALVEPGCPPRVHLRPLPVRGPRELERWLGLLDRQRASLAHELSGPATGVLAALETVLEYEPIQEGTRDLLEEARRGMLRLTRLLPAPPPPAASAEGPGEPLGGLLERACARIAASIDPDRETLEVRCGAPAEPVRLDEELLEEALGPLLLNAWRYRAGDRARAAVTGRAHPGWVEVEVADQGRGLEPGTLPRCGEPGFSTRPGGLGLGLFRLRWALRDRGAVALRPTPEGLAASLFLRIEDPSRGPVPRPPHV